MRIFAVSERSNSLSFQHPHLVSDARATLQASQASPWALTCLFSLYHALAQECLDQPKTYLGKSTPKVPQLVIELQNRPPNCKTGYNASSNLQNHYKLGPSAVLTPVLYDVEAESAWDPRGPHISECHISKVSLSPATSARSVFPLPSSL
jgi:hypothetical protein